MHQIKKYSKIVETFACSNIMECIFWQKFLDQIFRQKVRLIVFQQGSRKQDQNEPF